MIARILLLIVAWFAATEGIDGLHLNARYAGDPDNLSIAQAQSPAITLPAFVHITDARLDSSFCLTETTSKGEEEVKKLPCSFHCWTHRRVHSSPKGSPSPSMSLHNTTTAVSNTASIRCREFCAPIHPSIQ